jgi:hypothetical protein
MEFCALAIGTHVERQTRINTSLITITEFDFRLLGAVLLSP